MRSLIALVLAVGMVVGALYLRGAFDGDATGGPLARDEPLALVCSTELQAACDALAGSDVAVRTEEAGITAAGLTGGDIDVPDLWLTLAPWPQLVAEARRREGLEPLSTAGPIVLGRSPLVLVVRQDRAAALAQTCETDFSWRCVGRVARGTWAEAGGDVSWGRIKPGHTDPTANATGLLVLGQAVTDFLGTPDFSARDLQSDKFLSWFSDLEGAVPSVGAPGNTPLEQMVRLPATFDIVGTTEAEAGPLLARSDSSRTSKLIMRPATPLVVAEVVLAPLHPESEGRVGEVVEPAGPVLAAAGWRVEGQALAPGVSQSPLPDEPGIPDSGVLDALRSLWGEITR